MKTLAQILKIALTYLPSEGYVCHAIDRAYDMKAINKKEGEMALSAIRKMLRGTGTIPLWLDMQGISLDMNMSYINLRHMVISAWIDKLESLEEE